ncbi:MAG TPA: T9SS type A sorting domain-containing protein, partial [Bacteroidales bacterium]|nr:T9SS type A sorting domain-containing protein [Bacteroidales bacterium]
TDSVEACGGDPIDISWAIDKNGNKKEIESIDFIRIYTGVNFSDPILGEISTEISSIVDVKIKEEALPEIFIYPNPAQNIIYIQSNKPIIEANIINNLGQLVATSEQSNSIEVNNLSNGIYQLIIKTNDNIIVKPILISK